MTARRVAALALAAAWVIACEPAPTAGGSPGATASAPIASVAPPAGEAELALLSPIREGGTLGDFQVVRIHAVQRGVLRVVCKRAGATVRLDVALASDDAPPPPVKAGRFAVYYSLRSASPPDGENLAGLLAQVLEQNAKAPPPPGLGPYVPEAGGGTAL